MSNVEFVQMSELAVPKIKEVTNHKKGFVTNGEHNSYFRLLIELYQSSATNNAVINELSRLVYGKGLTLKAEEEKKQFNYFQKNSEEAFELEQKNKEANKPILDQINDIIKPKDLKRFITDRVILGQAALQIVYKGIGNRKTVAEVKHFPIHTLAAEKIKMVDVEAYYYHPKWEDYKPGDELKRLPAFGYGENIEIYVCQPYCPNMPYWSPVDYSGALDYAKLECEIASYLVNYVERGFSGTKVININKDATTQEEREMFKDYIMDKFTGYKGDPTLVSFNTLENEGIKVENVGTDDASKQYEYLSKEAARKILTGHRVTNPKLLGVPSMEGEGSGLGNNANEIEVAFDLFHNTVVEPFQEELLDGLKEILAINGIEEEICFERIEPIRQDLYQNAWQTQGLEEYTEEEMGSERDKEKEEKDNEAKGEK